MKLAENYLASVWSAPFHLSWASPLPVSICSITLPPLLQLRLSAILLPCPHLSTLSSVLYLLLPLLQLMCTVALLCNWICPKCAVIGYWWVIDVLLWTHLRWKAAGNSWQNVIHLTATGTLCYKSGLKARQTGLSPHSHFTNAGYVSWSDRWLYCVE